MQGAVIGYAFEHGDGARGKHAFRLQGRKRQIIRAAHGSAAERHFAGKQPFLLTFAFPVAPGDQVQINGIQTLPERKTVVADVDIVP